MAYILECFVATFLFHSVTSQSPTGDLKVDAGVLELPCPNAADIDPCICTVNPDYPTTGMDMDCSSVTSEEELLHIFNRPLPFYTFKKLNIDYNEDLTKLPTGSFGAASFEYISIQGGVLEEVETGALNGSYSKLRSLSIWNTDLNTFPFPELKHFTVLDTLSLTDNNITVFPNITSSSLRQLNVDGNPIEIIPQNAFDNLPKIESFDCSNCDIDEIFTAMVTGTNSLQYMTMNHNYITHLPKDAIELHGKDSSLYLKDNHISEADVNAIRGVNGNIDLDDNDIMFLYEDVWRPVVESVFSFTAAGNPLLCGCEIAWLKLNPDLMTKLRGEETCSNGEKLKDLDPQIYIKLCDLTTPTSLGL